MEVLEFMKQKNRMCDYYVDGCTRDGFSETCPAHDIDCETSTDKPEQLVAIVEQWAKEHPEVATTPKNGEPCVKTIQNALGGSRGKLTKHKVAPSLYGEKENRYGTEVHRKSRPRRGIFRGNREQNWQRSDNEERSPHLALGRSEQSFAACS